MLVKHSCFPKKTIIAGNLHRSLLVTDALDRFNVVFSLACCLTAATTVTDLFDPLFEHVNEGARLFLLCATLKGFPIMQALFQSMRIEVDLIREY